MKKLFYTGLTGLLLFEIANVYFIMPIPGSQEMNSLGLAYFLYSWRWIFRVLFIVMMIVGVRRAFASSKWLPAILMLIFAVIIYFVNFKMAADKMFYQPSALVLSKTDRNEVEDNRLVLGVAVNGEAKAYPIQFLGYHHQVRDSIGGKQVMVTYCTVCRTGRVFEPVVDGKIETFRLVGMDHYNAMFEDKTTKSWWQQATGKAVTGKLKGKQLPEVPSMQTTLGKWKQLHAETQIMQGDKKFEDEYKAMSNYEDGGQRGRLTKRDSGSWQPKSWVVGVSLNGEDKAYDWNQLIRERILYDVLGGRPVAVILAEDHKSFAALERLDGNQKFTFRNETLVSGAFANALDGSPQTDFAPALKRVNAYQEYWHSWKTFHPSTKKY